MNKILIALSLLVSLSGNSFAWTIIDIVSDYENDQIAYNSYYDRDNIKRDGNEIWVWTSMNIFFDGKNKFKGAKSQLYYWQYDCKEKRQTLHKVVTYSKHDLLGEVLKRYDYEGGYKWSYIIPNSVGDKLLKIVCK